MSVSTDTILDHLTDAVHRVLRDGESEWSWTWFHVMTAEERLGFDFFLVRMCDPLAYQAGSAEGRFRERVLRMALLERARREGKAVVPCPDHGFRVLE